MALSLIPSSRRYYFDLEECGVRTPDEEGRMCESLAAATLLAATGARSIMAAEMLDGKLCLGCAIEILDEDRSKVAVVAFRDVVEIIGV